MSDSETLAQGLREAGHDDLADKLEERLAAAAGGDEPSEQEPPTPLEQLRAAYQAAFSGGDAA